jgi:2-keto-4-pentenoate hydratase/2-oxohepta-3-ene-1,7-dioic acid hydratase in catechol pathway
MAMGGGQRGLALLGLVVLIGLSGFVFIGRSKPPQPLDTAPLVEQIAPPQQALSFAQLREDGELRTLLVLGRDDAGVRALDIGARFAMPGADPLDILDAVGRDTLVALAETETGTFHDPAGFLPSAGPGGAQIAAGANHPEHGEEVAIDSVFLFPKLSAATPARAEVAAGPEMLLDYEVELCARFDRDVASLDDFDAARIGVFLCGDMTDRAALLRGIDVDDRASGAGFADAKGGAGRFPTGPLLVVPADWQSFLAGERIQTSVDGAVFQDGEGADMIADLRELVAMALAEGTADRWAYGGRAVPLLADGTIPKGAAILTGTPDGVIFRPPGFNDRMTGFFSWAASGFSGSVVDAAIERYIASRPARGTFLQPGQEVAMRAPHLGRITLAIVAAP